MAEIPDTSPQPAVESLLSKFQMVSIAKVKSSRHQARKQFDEDSIKKLAESMKQETLLQPITVRQVGDEFELISGERRLRAAKLLGWETIEAKVIQPVSEGEAAAKGLIENLQRDDLTPLEEAEGFQELLDLEDAHWNQDQIAKATGRSKAYVSQSLSFLDFPASVKEKFSRLNFSRSHALEISRLPSPAQQDEVAQKIVDQDLTRENTRKLVDRMVGKIASPQTPLPEGEGGQSPGEAKVVSDPLAEIWKELTDQKRWAGQWKVSHPKEDEWAFHFKPDPERPVERLSEILSELGNRVMSFKLDKGDACR